MHLAENLHRFRRASVYLISRDDAKTWESTTGVVVRSQCPGRTVQLLDTGVLEVISSRDGRRLFKRTRRRA